jgi:glycosyltransferase involved in cell wall biosynthesis
MSTKPRASVVIPHLNQPDALEACLGSLDAQSLDRRSFEVIVVDNGSRTRPDAVVARHPGVSLLQELRPGPGPARNLGVEAASGEVFCFIDSDCRADPRWLESALKAVSSVPPRTVLGGDVRIWRDDPSKFTALEAYESVFAYRFKMYIERDGYSGTGNLVVPRADFERVGLFVGLETAEDVNWGLRARSAGLTFRYEPSMIVFHPARPTLQALCVKWDRHLQHELLVARTTRLWWAGCLARAFLLLISPLVDVGKIAASDRLQGQTARIKAAGVLVAIRAYRAWRMLAMLVSKEAVIWNRSPDIYSPRSRE